LDTTKITDAKTPIEPSKNSEFPGNIPDSKTYTPRGIADSQENLIPEDIAGEERSNPYIKTTSVLAASPRKTPRGENTNRSPGKVISSNLKCPHAKIFSIYLKLTIG
jgi:hypothetical protein